MKNVVLMVMLVTAAACPRGPGSTMTGAVDARGALQGFLAAVRAQDLQAVANVWGDERGPARDKFGPEELEQRTFILMRCLAHDEYRILDESTSGSGRAFAVQLRRGSEARRTTFYTLRGPADRWYVQRADMAPIEDFCRTPAPQQQRRP